jgi:branched-chain amino acid transport system substrate-binding protein
MKLRIGMALLCIALVGVAVAGCGGGGSSSGDSGGSSSADSGGGNSGTSGNGEFTVLFIGDQSGPLKTLGTNVYNGLRAAADYLNAEGGINGEKVKVVAANDNGDPQTSVQVLIKYLASNEAPDMVWSGIESNSTAALLPVVAQRGLFSFSYQDGPGLLGEGSTGEFPTQFTTFPPIQVPDEVVANYMKEQGYKKAAIAMEEIAIAEGEQPTFEAALEKVGIESTTAKMSPTATDVTPQIDELKGSGADVLYYNGVAENVGYGMSARAKLGWDVPVVGGMAFAAVDPTALASKQELEGVSFVNFKVTDGADEVPALAKVEKYIAKYGGVEGVGMNVVTLSWDALMATANAAEQAGSSEPEAMAEALQEVKEPKSERYATMPEYSYTAESHEPKITPAVREAYAVMGAGPLVEGRIQPFDEK